MPPSPADIAVVQSFVDHTLRTYDSVLEDGRHFRRPDESDLRSALAEFREGQGQRIVEEYRRLDDQEAADAGLSGAQLQAKSEIARRAGEDVVGAQQTIPRGAFSRPRIRRWLKRARVLVSSLKGLIPGAEALMELLDLLDGALDRP